MVTFSRIQTSIWSRVSSDVIVFRLRAGGENSYNWNRRRGKRFFSPPKGPDRLWMGPFPWGGGGGKAVCS
jgi:hypothetical protein